jgi:hypothetical protein
LDEQGQGDETELLVVSDGRGVVSCGGAMVRPSMAAGFLQGASFVKEKKEIRGKLGRGRVVGVCVADASSRWG